MEIELFFAPDDGGNGGGMSDGGISPEVSIGSEAGALESSEQPGGTPLAEPNASPSPFFTWEDEAGKKHEFHTPEDLKKAYGKGWLLQSDYTRKTQSLAKEREQMQAMQKRIQELDQRHASYDKFLKENPHIFRMLKEAKEKGTTGDVAVEKSQALIQEMKEELQKQIDEVKEWKAQKEFTAHRDTIYDGLKQRFPDFSRERIQTVMNDIDPTDIGSLAELLYYADKGRSLSSADQRARMAESQSRKQQARVMPGGGAATVVQKTSSESLDDARDLAMREIMNG